MVLPLACTSVRFTKVVTPVGSVLASQLLVVPFQSNACPSLGVPVFTSDKSVISAAAIRTSARASALAFVKYWFEPSVKFDVV